MLPHTPQKNFFAQNIFVVTTFFLICCPHPYYGVDFEQPGTSDVWFWEPFGSAAVVIIAAMLGLGGFLPKWISSIVVVFPRVENRSKIKNWIFDRLILILRR